MDASTERPLGAVRGALDRAHADLADRLRHWSTEIERRLVETENRMWSQERHVQELEGYLSRIAAIVGVDVGPFPDWTRVVAGVVEAADQVRSHEESASAATRRADDAQARARRAGSQAAVLARVAGRLGLGTTDPDAILDAIDALRRAAGRPAA